MRRFASLLLVMFLSACSVLQGTPQPAPPVADHPQEIRRDQSNGLQRLGTVSALVRGSPDDALAEIRAQANGIHRQFCIVNNIGLKFSQLYIALRLYAFTCAQ